MTLPVLLLTFNKRGLNMLRFLSNDNDDGDDDDGQVGGGVDDDEQRGECLLSRH